MRGAGWTETQALQHCVEVPSTSKLQHGPDVESKLGLRQLRHSLMLERLQYP